MFWILFLLVKLLGVNCDNENLTEIINISNNQSIGRLSASSSIPKYFFKYQPDGFFVLNSASRTYTKLPGLSVAFSHEQPQLYKIRFSGQCCIDGNHRHWFRILIDEDIIISNKLYHNNEGEGIRSISDLLFVDARGGGLYYTTNYIDMPCIKFETVYVPAGIHVVSVGARTDKWFRTYNGELSVETIQFSQDANINLPHLTWNSSLSISQWQLRSLLTLSFIFLE